MALVTTAVSPILWLGVYGMAKLQWGNRGGSAGRQKGLVADDYSKANGLLSELILNYKTIISFGEGNIDYIVEKFSGYLEGPRDRRIRN